MTGIELIAAERDRHGYLAGGTDADAVRFTGKNGMSPWEGSNREAIIELGGKIANLRVEFQRIKQELKAAEQEFDRLLEQGQRVAITVAAADGSLNQKIVAVIDSGPARQFTAEDMFAKFPEAKQTSIRSALSRLAGQGKIRRLERGEYTSARPASGG